MAGTYKQEISATKNLPMCLVVLLDQSGSMAEQFGADKRSKAVAAARAVNTALAEMMAPCTKGEKFRDYYHIGVIGYGANAAQDLLGSGSAPGGLFTPGELDSKAGKERIQLDEDDGTGKLKVVERAKWFDPVCAGGTPMEDAFQQATEKLKQWVAKYPNSFPPILMNITDGEANVPEAAEAAAQALRQISTNDGEALLFNCHLSATGAPTVEYPVSDINLPDDHSKWLFRISSDIPETMVKNAQKTGLSAVTTGSRGFVYNATAAKLIRFLETGTKVVTPGFDR